MSRAASAGRLAAAAAVGGGARRPWWVALRRAAHRGDLGPPGDRDRGAHSSRSERPVRRHAARSPHPAGRPRRLGRGGIRRQDSPGDLRRLSGDGPLDDRPPPGAAPLAGQSGGGDHRPDGPDRAGDVPQPGCGGGDHRRQRRDPPGQAPGLHRRASARGDHAAARKRAAWLAAFRRPPGRGRNLPRPGHRAAARRSAAAGRPAVEPSARGGTDDCLRRVRRSLRVSRVVAWPGLRGRTAWRCSDPTATTRHPRVTAAWPRRCCPRWRTPTACSPTTARSQRRSGGRACSPWPGPRSWRPHTPAARYRTSACQAAADLNGRGRALLMRRRRHLIPTVHPVSPEYPDLLAEAAT